MSHENVEITRRWIALTRGQNHTLPMLLAQLWPKRPDHRSATAIDRAASMEPKRVSAKRDSSSCVVSRRRHRCGLRNRRSQVRILSGALPETKQFARKCAESPQSGQNRPKPAWTSIPGSHV
jgi:hypothetical protein